MKGKLTRDSMFKKTFPLFFPKNQTHAQEEREEKRGTRRVHPREEKPKNISTKTENANLIMQTHGTRILCDNTEIICLLLGKNEEKMKGKFARHGLFRKTFP